MGAELLGYIFPAVIMVILLLFFAYYFHVLGPTPGTTEWIGMAVRKPTFFDSLARCPLEGADIPAMLTICLVYAAMSVLALFFTGYGMVYGVSAALPAGSAQPLWEPLYGALTGIFGALPFSEHYAGIVFGVLILAIMYCFIKNLSGRTAVAVCGTLLLLFDLLFFVQCGHNAQGACASFFILLAYYGLYLRLTVPDDCPLWREALSMLLCGLSFAAGCAVSPTVLLSAPGLLAVYIAGLAVRGAAMPRFELDGYLVRVLLTLAQTLFFFVIVPALVYCLCFIPAAFSGAAPSLSAGFSALPAYFTHIIAALGGMFRDLASAFGAPSVSSGWLCWMLALSPEIRWQSAPGAEFSAVASLGSPVVCWGGLLAMIALAARIFRQRDGRALIVLFAYLLLLAPWIFIARAGGVSEYLPASLFLAPALAVVFDTLYSRERGSYRAAVLGFTILAALVFAAYLPALCGIPAPASYTDILLGWLPGRPF